MTGPVYLSMCAACGAHPSAVMVATEVPQPPPFYCRKCRKGLIPAEEHAFPETAVRLLDMPGGPGREWVVLTRDGDKLTVRPLGRPDVPCSEVSLGMVRPKFSYGRLYSGGR